MSKDLAYHRPNDRYKGETLSLSTPKIRTKHSNANREEDIGDERKVLSTVDLWKSLVMKVLNGSMKPEPLGLGGSKKNQRKPWQQVKVRGITAAYNHHRDSRNHRRWKLPIFRDDGSRVVKRPYIPRISRS